MLRLKKDLLSELATDDLAQVVAGQQGPDTNDERCVSGVIRCTQDVVKEMLTLSVRVC